MQWTADVTKALGLTKERGDKKALKSLKKKQVSATLCVPDNTHTSYLIILVTCINAPLSLVLFMSLYSLYMLTTLVFACFIVFLLFCASAVYFLCSGVRLSHLSDKSLLT